MASPPPFTFSADAPASWRVAVWLVVALACAALAIWWWQRPAPAPWWVGGAVVAGCAGAIACGLATWHQPRSVLHWDRQDWLLESGTAAPRAGTLEVAIDLGSWMLLRFVPVPGGRSGPELLAVRWLAVERGRLGFEWHALRCTLYAPRTRRTAAE
jgi:hypothetical protein